MVAKPPIKSEQRRSIWQRFLSIFRASPENPTTSLANPASWLTALFGPTSKAGVKVTAESVIGMTAMWRAINILAETIASLPFEVIEHKKNGDIDLATDHSVYNLINSEPNPLYTSFTYRHTSMVHACLFGNWVSIIERNQKDNRPSRLHIVDARKVTPVLIDSKETNLGELFYKVEGHDKTYHSRDVIHVPNLSFSGLGGLNVLATHTDNFGMGLANRDYINTYYKNGSMLGGWIEHPTMLSDDQYNRLKGSFRMEYGGTSGSGSTPVLEAGSKYHQIDANLQDAQSINFAKFNVEDISRITGVPVHMLQSLDRATFNNIEQLSLEFAMYTIRPWVKRIEQEFNRKIFRESEKGRFKVRLNMDSLLRGDFKTRMEGYKILFNMGVLNRNEIRQREKWNAIPGGDRRYMQVNMGWIEEDGSIVNPNTKQTQSTEQ